MTTNEQFHSRILEHKSDISKSTLASYTSMLRNMYYKANNTTKADPIDFDWYLNDTEVLKSIEDKDPKVRKTYLSALLALVGKTEGAKYSQQLNSDVKVYNKWVEKQEMTPQQQENWMPYDKVMKIVQVYEKQAKDLKKQLRNPKRDREVMEDWLLLALTTGYYFPPRRSLDWVKMKFRNYDKETDNYVDLKKNVFVFNQYKTASTFGKQEVKFKSRVFKTLLQSYLSMMPEGVDRLLNDLKWEEFSNVRMAQRLNKIFGLHISTSMLRHIYLSHTLESVPPLEKLQELAKQMGHSVPQQLEYIKR